jgi:hypothetical protein
MSSREVGSVAEQVYPVPAEWAKRAWADQAKYKEMYARSISDPKGFWADQAKRLDWMKAPHKIDNWSFAPGNISIKWFEDGVLIRDSMRRPRRALSAARLTQPHNARLA